MINIKSHSQIEKMKRSAAILIKVFEAVRQAVEPGVTTEYLDRIAAEVIKANNAEPSFKGQPGMSRDAKPFPACICASRNSEVIHGIPSKHTILQEGDIISIDAGGVFEGFHSDAARTFPVGIISDDAARLIEVTKQSFFAGAAQAVEGNRIGDIAREVQTVAENAGYGVVRDFVGHGIGEELHEDPSVPNYVCVRRGARLQNGMAIAIEPMINVGTYEIKIDPDNKWTVYTADGKLSAHYENTVIVTSGEPMIITLEQ